MPYRTFGSFSTGKFYGTPSEVLQCSHDAEGSTAATSPTKVKTITITDLAIASGVKLRIKFDLKEGTAGYPAQAQIYKNGVSAGTLRGESTGVYVTFSEDLTFAKNDTVELWCYCSSGYYAWYRNLRIYGDVINASPTGITGVNS